MDQRRFALTAAPESDRAITHEYGKYAAAWLHNSPLREPSGPPTVTFCCLGDSRVTIVLINFESEVARSRTIQVCCGKVENCFSPPGGISDVSPKCISVPAFGPSGTRQ